MIFRKYFLDAKIILAIMLGLTITVIYDYFISSRSFIPLRYIYDISIYMITTITIYLCIHFIKNLRWLNISYKFRIPNYIIFITGVFVCGNIVHNLLIINNYTMGEFDYNSLNISTFQMMYFLKYLTVLFVLGVIFLYNIQNSIIRFSVIWEYILSISVLLAALSIWGYAILGIYGIKIAIIMFSIMNLLIFLYKLKNSQNSYIYLEIDINDICLIGVVISVLSLFYYTAFFSIYYDQGIVLSSLTSLIYRGSLRPFYEISGYYVGISSYISINYIYLSGNPNLISASVLPYFLGYVSLPFIIYRILLLLVSNDDRLILLATIVILLMDGLAILIIPKYILLDKLSFQTIYWEVSTATKSLRASTILYFWFNPYKILAMSLALASVLMMITKNKINILLSGGLFAFSLIHPRQPFAFLVGALTLWILKIVDIKEIFIVLLTSSLYLSFELVGSYFALFKGIFFYLIKLTKFELLRSYYRIIMRSPPSIDFLHALIINLILLISVAYIMMKLSFRNNQELVKDFRLIRTNYSSINLGLKFRIFGSRFIITSDLDTIVGLIMLAFLIFLILIFYKILYFPYFIFINNRYFNAFTYFVLRYHIVFVFIIVSFLISNNTTYLKFFSIIFLIQYIGILQWLHAPIFVVMLGMPAMHYILNTNKKITKILVIIFIILGILSASLFSSTQRHDKVGSEIKDLPKVLPILLNITPCEKIYTPSWYRYYVNKLASFAHVKVTREPTTSFYLVDIKYTDASLIHKLVTQYKIVYRGERFLVLEAKQD